MAKLGAHHRGFLRYDTQVSLRGVFWYPPGGFDSWHTDGTLAQGWRLYLIDPDPRQASNSSYLAYRDSASGGYVRVADAAPRINMFEVNAAAPLWHAVASARGHRLSVGLAISDATAAMLLRRLAAHSAHAEGQQ